MDIDELKMAWHDYDQKLQSARSISETIITSMIRERSHSRLEKVISLHIYGIIYLTCMILLGMAILAGNPFDYRQFIEFIPVGIYTVSMILIGAGMLRSLNRLRKVDLNTGDVDSSLNKIIEIYQTPGKHLYISLKLLFFSAVVLFPLSFLPRKIEASGLSHALLDTLIPMILSGFMLFAAYKLGAFKETNMEKFKRDKEELSALKSIAEELRSDV
jgi:hypothetical protein